MHFLLTSIVLFNVGKLIDYPKAKIHHVWTKLFSSFCWYTIWSRTIICK